MISFLSWEDESSRVESKGKTDQRRYFIRISPRELREAGRTAADRSSSGRLAMSALCRTTSFNSAGLEILRSFFSSSRYVTCASLSSLDVGERRRRNSRSFLTNGVLLVPRPWRARGMKNAVVKLDNLFFSSVQNEKRTIITSDKPRFFPLPLSPVCRSDATLSFQGLFFTL